MVLCGNHLVMSTIGACLRERPEFQLEQINALSPEIVAKLESAPPDAILFDLAAAQPEFAMPLLRSKSDMILIGVDVARNKMLVLSGEQSRLLTADDLVQVIKRGGS